MSNHYVFLRPGEKIFILTDDVAGDSDYTHVFEAEIPVFPMRDPEGRQYHNPESGHIVDVRQYRRLELNDCANLTSGDYPGSTVLEAYARVNEKRLGNNPDHAFVAKPVGEWSEVDQLQAESALMWEMINDYGKQRDDGTWEHPFFDVIKRLHPRQARRVIDADRAVQRARERGARVRE